VVSEGEAAPDFELPSHTGEKIRLSNLKGHYVVLYFYPRAMTPGCTREAEVFNKHLDDFEKLNVIVLGVSTDSVERNRKFAEKHNLRFKLLSDTEGKVAQLYGVLRKGTSRPSAERVTFVIDPQGTVRAVIKGVRAEEHPLRALDVIRELQQQAR